MELLLSLFVGAVLRADVLLLESRQVIGIAAAVVAAMLAAQLGWHGTDWLITSRGRSEED